jgi:hypothetical protein
MFFDAELRARDAAAFADLKSQGLLRHLPDLTAGDCYPFGDKLLTIVERPGGGLDGLDLEDPNVPSRQLSDSERVRWDLDRMATARRFQEANELLGLVGELPGNVIYLGDKILSGRKTAFLLALVPADDRGAATLLATKMALTGSQQVVAICPCYRPDLEAINRLLQHGTHVVPLNPSDPFLLPTRLYGQGTSSLLSDDCRQAFWEGECSPLTPNQARVVELLAMGQPLSQAHILETLEISSKNLFQVFRGSWAWGSLVVPARGQGMYTLSSLFLH